MARLAANEFGVHFSGFLRVLGTGSRALVTDSQGQAILVVYNEAGQEVSEVSLSAPWNTQVEALQIRAAASWRAEKQRMDEAMSNAQIGLGAKPLLLKADLNRNGYLDSLYVGKEVITTDGRPPNDRSTPERAYPFWLNDDFDVVQLKDQLLSERNECDPDWLPPRVQTCESYDATPGTAETQRHNTDAAGLKLIESLRDLEDFAPLALVLDSRSLQGLRQGELSLRLQAQGVGINLFKGVWRDQRPLSYLLDACAAATDTATPIAADCPARQQAERINQGQQSRHWLTQLLPGASLTLNVQDAGQKTLLGRLLVEDAVQGDASNPEQWGTVARLLFEGTHACAGAPKDCYLEVAVLEKAGRLLRKQRLYLNLQPVKRFYDHYTLGEWFECLNAADPEQCPKNAGPVSPDNALVFHQDQPARDVHVKGANAIITQEGNEMPSAWQQPFPFTDPIARGTDSVKDSVKNHYILLVHGWRMPYREKIIFAETSFKRLYWLGYRGRFGLFSWPTGFFPRKAWAGDSVSPFSGGSSGALTWGDTSPAWQFGADLLVNILEDQQNYSRSERIARHAGPRLSGLLTQLKAGYSQLDVMAHSMGNVVMSEALRAASAPLVSHYAALNAATVAGAYANLQQRDADGRAQEELSVGITGGTSFADEIEEGGSLSEFFPDWLSAVWQQTQAGVLPCTRGDLGPVDAWRCVNIEGDSWSNHWYDIPPDYYRFAALLGDARNTQRQPDPLLETHEGRRYYYQGISEKASGHITNFVNRYDAALSGWNLQQITKPDSGLTNETGGGWRYLPKVSNSETCDGDYEGLKVRMQQEPLQTGDLCQVLGSFEGPAGAQSWPKDQKELLAHVIPARTFALGAMEGVDGASREARFEKEKTKKPEAEQLSKISEISSQVILGDFHLGEFSNKGKLKGSRDLTLGGHKEQPYQFNFNNTNWDHSAAWMSDMPKRAPFWRALLQIGFELTPVYSVPAKASQTTGTSP